jgi:hypothetical protein
MVLHGRHGSYISALAPDDAKSLYPTVGLCRGAHSAAEMALEYKIARGSGQYVEKIRCVKGKHEVYQMSMAD